MCWFYTSSLFDCFYFCALIYNVYINPAVTAASKMASMNCVKASLSLCVIPDLFNFV